MFDMSGAVDAPPDPPSTEHPAVSQCNDSDRIYSDGFLSHHLLIGFLRDLINYELSIMMTGSKRK